MLSKKPSGASLARKVSESRVGQNTTSKRGNETRTSDTPSLSFASSKKERLYASTLRRRVKKRRRTVIPSAGFFCKSLIWSTIAPTAPLETWSMMMMILMSLPPSRFSPKPLLKRQRWVGRIALSLSLSLSLSFSLRRRCRRYKSSRRKRCRSKCSFKTQSRLSFVRSFAQKREL